MATGINVSKAQIAAVTAPPKGVSASRLQAAVVTAPPKGIATSKALAYAVCTYLGPAPTGRGFVQVCG